MGYIEIFRVNENGAGWVDLSEATSKELLDLEIGLELEGSPVLPIVSDNWYNTANKTKGKLKWQK